MCKYRKDTRGDCYCQIAINIASPHEGPIYRESILHGPGPQ